MSITRSLVAALVCAVACTPVQALLSVNVLQDNTSVPGWVINTFTVDSIEQDITVAVALSDLSSGSMLQVPGFYPFKQSNGLGDSYVSINDDPNTNGWLGSGDLGGPEDAFFDETGIGMAWYNIGTNDTGLGMHLATLTFSSNAVGDFTLLLAGSEGLRRSDYEILDGAIELYSTVDPRPIPDPPIDPDPLPDPGEDPGTGGGPIDPGPGGGDPGGDGGSNTIPEPAALGLIGLVVAAFGGLHRRRLVSTPV